MANAALPNRIDSIESSGRRVAVRDTIPVRARLASDAGAAAGNETLSSVTLHFGLSDAQQADLNKLLQDQQNPASALYHQWLTPAQFGARFGLSADDLAKVKVWLQGQGLSVTSISPSMNYITVGGTITQINAAFNTSIHLLNEDGESHIGNLSDPALPAALANVVTEITGLNDFRPKARIRATHVPFAMVQPRFTSSISGSHFIAPGDFYTIYNINPLLQNSIMGTGITIAVVGQTDISLADVAAFRSASGLPASAPTIVQVPSLYTSGTSSGDIDEAQLDVEWSGAVAPGATIKFVTVGPPSSTRSRTASVMDALTYAISSRAAPIITISYGLCETSAGQNYLNTFNTYFQQANAQGITIVGPSGDSGATDCDYGNNTATQGLTIDFPASSPNVTAAGGTMFNEGTGNYWNSTNGNYQGSARSYIPEVVWNETTANSRLSASGGGVSKFFSKPDWQYGTGVPSNSVRNIPDISLNSAASHDGYLYCTRGSCVNGYRDANNGLSVVGGTSAASPAFAGILALLEQQIQSTGIGNANPKIYGLANSTYYGNVFHDVTSGNNNSPCVAGTTDCASGGTIGYSANTGYDLATGWGSVDAYNLVTMWNLVSPASGGGVASSGDFTIAGPSTAVSVQAGGTVSIPLTLTSTNGFAGTISLAATGVSSSGASLTATYTFSPTSPVTVTTNGSTAVTLSLAALRTNSASLAVPRSQTVVADARDLHPRHVWYGAGSGGVLACTLLLAAPRRRRWGALLLAVLSVSAFTVTGCGTGGTPTASSSTGTTTTTTNATVGTYVVTVTGTSGSLTHTTTITLNVTN